MVGNARRFFFILGEYKRELPLLLVLFLLSAALEMLGLAFLASFIAVLVSHEVIMRHAVGQWISESTGAATQGELIVLLGAALLIVLLVRMVIVLWIQWIKQDYVARVRSTLVTKLVGNYLRVPWTFHLQRNSVEALQAINGHSLTFVAKVLLPVLQLAVGCATGLSILFLLLLVNPIATVSVLLLVLVVIASTDMLIKNRLKECGRRQMQAAQALSQTVKQSIYAGKEIRVLGCEQEFVEESRLHADIIRNTSRYVEVINAVPRLVLELAIVAFIVGFSLIWLDADGARDIVVTLSIFGLAGVRLTPLATQISVAMVALRGASAPLQRLYEDLNAYAAVSGRDSGGKIVSEATVNQPEPFSSLELRGVVYRYPTSQAPSLRDISIKLRSGECLGIVGQSGSGKTTLVDIMLGLLSPTQGSVLVNNRDLSEMHKYWRQTAAYIPQEIYLMDGSIRDNVAFGVRCDAVSDDQVWRALSMARLDEIVRSLPNGLHTRTGERGLRLSGGQRQRIALARAFYHDRQVLFLDEATSSLDHETETEIAHTIDELRNRKTLVLIAHRLSIIARCDRVIRLDQGHVNAEILEPARLVN